MSDFEGRIRALPDMEKRALSKAGPLAGSWGLELPFPLADLRRVRAMMMDGVRGDPDIKVLKVIYDRSTPWRIGDGAVHLRLGLGFYARNGFETANDTKQGVTYLDAEVVPEAVEGILLGVPSRYANVEYLKAAAGESKTPAEKLVDTMVGAFITSGSAVPIYGPERQLLWPIAMTEAEMQANYDLLRRAPRLHPE